MSLPFIIFHCLVQIQKNVNNAWAQILSPLWWVTPQWSFWFPQPQIAKEPLPDLAAHLCNKISVPFQGRGLCCEILFYFLTLKFIKMLFC